MASRRQFDLHPTNLERARLFWLRYANHPQVQERRRSNVEATPRPPSARVFWQKLMMGFLTSQQNSSRGAPVHRFLHEEPFALDLSVCRTRAGDLRSFVSDTLVGHGGIRFTRKLGEVISTAFLVLDSMVSGDDITGDLASQLSPLCDPGHDAASERRAALYLARSFKGIGPKQSRNVLQALGLTRYEVPIDSRLMKWLDYHQIFTTTKHSLVRNSYYDEVSREFQRMCQLLDVLPCLMDAAIFASLERGVQEEFPIGSQVLLAQEVCELLGVDRSTEFVLRSSNEELGAVETPSGMRAVVPLATLVPVTWGLEPR